MNLRIVRKKIKSIANVKKITKAMQLVSAVKMKKSQQAALDGKPYRYNLERIIQAVTAVVKPEESILLSQPEMAIEKDLIIFITSNKGLCGAFNFNLFRFLLKNFDLKKTEFITVGKKGATFLTNIGGKIVADFSRPPSINHVSPIFQASLFGFLKKEYRAVYLVYNQFISSLKFESVKKTVLPIKKEELCEGEIIKPLIKDFLIEPKSIEIINELLKSYLEEKIRGAILESEASEHSARMIAMKNATDNAQEVIENLILLRNKVRQTKITYELLDMVTAKESIE